MVYTSLGSLPSPSVSGYVPPSPTSTPPSVVNVNTSGQVTIEMLLASAKEDLSTKKNNFYVAYANYIALSRVNPMLDAARHASSIKNEAQELFEDAQTALEILEKSNAPAVVLEDKKSMVVPSNLPFLQLCIEPKGKAYKWKKAEGLLLDHYNTPFRRFLNMGRVWKMMQKKGESVRAFGAKFQTARRQASLEDGIQMAFCFWWNLCPEVQEASLIHLSTNYSTKLPSKVEDIILLVSVATSNYTALLNQRAESGTPAKWKSFTDAHGASSSISHKGKKRAFVRNNDPKPAKKSWSFKKAIKDNVCFSCKGVWEKGDTSPKRENYLMKVSTMALHTPTDRSARSSSAADGLPLLLLLVSLFCCWWALFYC
ncbi:hypothetical protein PHYBLDRAFT_66303 [Phycomyces blakesleeanus NRRL 1555(-)]|uniref:Uncharacterized protein n=1 Tax=Phycomyces blakesleeanus (strain ATCC 8743b / DSM 1359 / FGSC 10004 / NBRC 33097 / NRRL 1555) TaxID=763407 RepID=A0A162WPT5_PHYB8|nr:hypothetical protein PHYBLDRAFT_66303 [Phycomyces blakesleeanus NRRL 1555(-)]OAD69475.1 hypothetical protein PHYBLDRAFT_66303 [Phycomyces blakesleeanus NRRL 1555(-)]|eukprot:XP_018287515.1 hypothetical protein PHYBLDRAFT_66303 [Phycomyces blakesleeanus NRRL 1555(-)]